MRKTKGLVSFAANILGANLWDVQRDILNAIEQYRQVAIAACHASGKSYVAACAAIGFAALHADSRVLTIAPGWLMTRTVLWSEIHSLLQRAKYKLPIVSATQTEIRLGPKNMILGLSAADAGRLQGHHAEHILIIADEAAALDDSFWPAIHGVLASGNSRLLILGNPTTTTGYFRDAFGRNRAAWHAITISAFDCPNLKGLTVGDVLAMKDDELDSNQRPYLCTRRWIKERWAEWWNGDVSNSPLWASRVLGQFPTESSNALFPLSALEAARRPAVDPGGDVIVGIDVAGPGKDRTTAVACSGDSIIEIAAWAETDARGPVIAFLKKWSGRLRIARVDSSGMGWYFLQSIRDAGFRVEPINVGSTAKDSERFANAKAERYQFLRDRLVKGGVSGLSDDLFGELSVVNYLIDARGETQIEDKASVRSILGRSPDLAEALLMAWGEPRPEPFRYQPVGNQFVFHRTTPGSRELTGREQDARDDAEAAAQRQHRRFAAYSPRIGRKGVGW
jgi:phage terminase large subunit